MSYFQNLLRRIIDTEKNYGFTSSYCFYTIRSIGVANPNFQQVYTQLIMHINRNMKLNIQGLLQQQNRIKSNFLEKITHVLKSLTICEVLASQLKCRN
ncbi:unnamed protein product [Paramecium octaurelia]|uniref:Uncharacterized protein n=1 Tax=Paramecium octaurelia TaxID=43137 RepID=A0A8S1RXM1_PAROT|nr:unnamed protein product [Paramecium octaurelia]